ncbi:MAG: sugar phosphate isomerase/epimerase [Pirellulaceae bacterium]
MAASTDCFDQLSLDDALDKLVDLEFTTIELPLHEGYDFLKPSQILANLERAVEICHNTRRLNLAAYDVEIAAEGDEYYEQFGACCKLAKATKVVTITIPSGEHGTPFNEEVERLRKLVALGSLEGVRVSMKSQVGRLSEDPDTVAVLCDNVEGLGLTLDPSHYICGPHKGKSIDKLMKYVYHVLLRDTTQQEMQVRVGQGEVDYGRLITQLRKVKYNRALCIYMQELPEIDHVAEMRKMRLLLESLLI